MRMITERHGLQGLRSQYRWKTETKVVIITENLDGLLIIHIEPNLHRNMISNLARMYYSYIRSLFFHQQFDDISLECSILRELGSHVFHHVEKQFFSNFRYLKISFIKRKSILLFRYQKMALICNSGSAIRKKHQKSS